MVQGKQKSSHFRKVQRRVPGGRTATHYREGKPNQASCGSCGKKLHGIPRLSPTEAKNAPKSMKRPERPYGGTLCSACTRTKIIGEYA